MTELAGQNINDSGIDKAAEIQFVDHGKRLSQIVKVMVRQLTE
jgi:hypothetical protein